ncbi:MAG TPA: hypothetical protein V6D22_10700 [Candidatus Obscuribacterales bacterium]
MKKDGGSPARQGINSVYDLNDLLNELWHIIPAGKQRKTLDTVERVLHKRICNQQNPDCWLCQFQYWREIEAMAGRRSLSEPNEPVQPKELTFNVVRWLNESINAHLRARQLGQSPPQPKELLDGVHLEACRKSSHAVNCMFCVINGIDACLPGITKEQRSTWLSESGFKPMLEFKSLGPDDLS